MWAIHQGMPVHRVIGGSWPVTGLARRRDSTAWCSSRSGMASGAVPWHRARIMAAEVLAEVKDTVGLAPAPS